MKQAQIPSELIVITKDLSYENGRGERVELIVDYATGRTSKGNETHIVHPSALGGLSTNCGLDGHGRMRHSVWAVQKSRITCEKCNGTKVSKRANAEHIKAFAALFG